MTLAPTTTSTAESKLLIVVLDKASLEIVRIGKSSSSAAAKDTARYHLLNSDDHQSILRRSARSDTSTLYRPDITHQCLLTLLDSPLNKSGHLRIFIRTQRGVLIEINPRIRIPRTYSRFAGLMVQLLHKLSIKSTEGGETLLNVVRNPISLHLPVGSIMIGLSDGGPSTSNSSCTPANPTKVVARLQDRAKHLQQQGRVPVVFVGAMAHGEDLFVGAEEYVSVSGYAVSASVACGKLCDVFEREWGIY